MALKYGTVNTITGKYYNRETGKFIDNQNEALYDTPYCVSRKNKKNGTFKSFSWPSNCINFRVEVSE